MRLFVSAFFLLIFFKTGFSQDRLFSQFYASPLTLNPALTGAFEGKYRVSAIYRDQWSKALESPYATFSTALDLRWRMGRSTARYHDHAAVGVMFFNDKAGVLDFSTTQISVSAAYHKALDIRNTQVLSLGIQAGIAQRNLNYADATFEDQFNGTTGYTDDTEEIFPENNYAFGDYSVGLNYVYSPKYTNFRVFAGGAIHHFLTPSLSFFRNEDDESLAPENNLGIRYAGQVSAQMPVTKAIQFLPRVIVDKQDNHLKFDAGANFRFNTSEYRNIAIHIGAYARPVANENDSFRLDALVTLVGIEFNNVLLGMSYDLNMGDLSNYNRRAFEISVAYLGEYEDDLILCPKF
jgi:type IX secretion system PorP/SprF family membrane protein